MKDEASRTSWVSAPHSVRAREVPAKGIARFVIYMEAAEDQEQQDN